MSTSHLHSSGCCFGELRRSNGGHLSNQLLDLFRDLQSPGGVELRSVRYGMGWHFYYRFVVEMRSSGRHSMDQPLDSFYILLGRKGVHSQYCSNPVLLLLPHPTNPDQNRLGHSLLLGVWEKRKFLKAKAHALPHPGCERKHSSAKKEKYIGEKKDTRV